MNADTKAYTIVKEQMYDNDAFSQWLGIEIETLTIGKVVLKMKVRPEMTNGFGIVHGGICYSLADSALAFAANSHGRQSVSIETSISYISSVKTGAILTATTIEESRNHRIAIYQIRVCTEDETMVALFKGAVYRSSKEWL